MRTLVVYYSNSGNTKAVAEALADRLGADIEEIREQEPRPLLQVTEGDEKPEGSALMKAAIRAWLGLGSRIEETGHDPSGYDLVVVGSPTWVGRLVPAVRSYLKKHRAHMKQVAFFCTGGEPEKSRALRQMEGVAHVAAVAKMVVSADDIRAGTHDRHVSAFARKLVST